MLSNQLIKPKYVIKAFLDSSTRTKSIEFLLERKNEKAYLHAP